MTKDEALKMALEALENSRSLEPVDVLWVKGKRHAAIIAIHKALAEESSGTEQPKLFDYEPDGMHHNKPHKCKYPKCDYPCPDLPDCRDAEQSAQQIVEEYDPDNRTISVYPSEWKAQQQEPVAHVYLFDPNGRPRVAWDNAKDIKIGDKLYTSPLASKPLTDEQISNIWYEQNREFGYAIRFARAIEAAHGIKGEA